MEKHAGKKSSLSADLDADWPHTGQQNLSLNKLGVETRERKPCVSFFPLANQRDLNVIFLFIPYEIHPEGYDTVIDYDV